MAMVKRALISVYDKSGLEELVEALGEFDFEIVSSGGTARRIKEIGYGKLKEVGEYTGHPESPGGLLKTLHPKIHGGLLLDPRDPQHRTYMDRHGIEPIDIVVCNLYPFEEAVARGADLMTAAENIDIGGPTMTRSAAKAALLYGRVGVVTDPSQYGEVMEALRSNQGSLPSELIRELAEKAFKRTSEYDTAITSYLRGLEE
ncbi:MAG: IMP cyclohydrolase [Candidatus Bathyarchaeota archaeon]|nr:MAG: IMP cyclohydrolase [Candidatus Bathyarchaeota archaeon]